VNATQTGSQGTTARLHLAGSRRRWRARRTRGDRVGSGSGCVFDDMSSTAEHGQLRRKHLRTALQPKSSTTA